MICKICLKKITTQQRHDSYHDECFRSTFGTIKVHPMLPFSRNEFKTQKAANNTRKFSISGVQPKLLIKIQKENLEITESGGTHIIKVSPEEYPFAAENEHLTMEIFRLMKFDTAKCGLMPLKDEELVYITKRFDRDKNEMIHQEDMMQAMGISNIESSKYDSRSYQDVGTFLFQQGKNLIVVGEFFKRVVLNFLVGNDDYHLKNISIRPEFINQGNKFLTPIYDSLNIGIYRNGPSLAGEMALLLINDNDGFSEDFQINGFHSKKCFEYFAKELGLNARYTKTFYTSYEKSFPKIQELIDNSFLPIEMKNKYKEVLRERLKKLNT